LFDVFGFFQIALVAELFEMSQMKKYIHYSAKVHGNSRINRVAI